MEYYAHRVPETNRQQTLLEHLTGTAKLAREFASAFGAGPVGELCGLAHDIGKFSQAFQRRLMGDTARVDHSTAGAVESCRIKNMPAAFCVAGHHGGLMDGGDKAALPGTFMGRLKKAESLEDYSAFHSQILLPHAEIPEAFRANPAAATFFTRMLYACLVDADYLDTEAFMQNRQVERGGFPALSEYRGALTAQFAAKRWLQNHGSDLFGLRSEILRAALAAASDAPGLFTFTAPTGSGKTLASAAFALDHCIQNQLRRVIYVIPYCSIIEQTHEVFEGIFGPGSVVAHYANVDYAHDENGGRDRRYLASENWDAPVILTTTVQFFESLYANRSSRCRKLHNLAQSVIVFDEAQMLPPSILRPCVHAIGQLVKHYGCSAVLCTATQPALGRLLEGEGVEIVREICPRPKAMYEAFRRVRFEKLGKVSDGELMERLCGQEQALCVVNSRKEARALYNLLPGEGRYYLTTTLYPLERRRRINAIRERLKNGLPCRVISTSLVEAGVDMDFPCVYREIAGLDSILQAAGRCNREGKKSIAESVVYVFESEHRQPPMLSQNRSSSATVMNRFEDIASPEAVAAYFEDLFYVAMGVEALDNKGVMKLCNDGTFPFATIAKQFSVIVSEQKTVYIPTEESQPLLEQLQEQGPSRELMRKLGLYAVGVYPELYDELMGAGDIRPVAENAAVLTNMEKYDGETGLTLEGETGVGIFM